MIIELNNQQMCETIAIYINTINNTIDNALVGSTQYTILRRMQLLEKCDALVTSESHL